MAHLFRQLAFPRVSLAPEHSHHRCSDGNHSLPAATFLQDELGQLWGTGFNMCISFGVDSILRSDRRGERHNPSQLQVLVQVPKHTPQANTPCRMAAEQKVCFGGAMLCGTNMHTAMTSPVH